MPSLNPYYGKLDGSPDWYEQTTFGVRELIAHDNQEEVWSATGRRSYQGLGKPRSKSVVDPLDVVAVLVSLISLGLAVAVVSKDWSLAWRLGVTNQFVVIGFLLSIMNFCIRRVAPVAWGTLESRFGPSTLQNYDAILRNTALLKHTSVSWKVMILIFTFLPIALSAAYKQFTGAFASSRVQSMEGRWYIMSGPGQVNQIGSSGGNALAFNATTPFLLAAATESDPPVHSLPRPYGFNHLWLSNHSAAMLDIPTSANVSLLQSKLRFGEWWRLTAPVNATVSRYNDVIDKNRYNSTWWGEFQGDVRPPPYLHTWAQNDTVVLLMNEWYLNQSWAIVGYNNTTPLQFNKTSWFYNVDREKCHGSWDITQTSISLISGNCSGEKVEGDNTYDSRTYIMYSFFMNFMKEVAGPYSPYGSRNTSNWGTPVWTSTIAGMFWARAQGVNDTWRQPAFVHDQVFLYTPVMSTNWLLYLVLAVQPLITIILFVCGIVFYSEPIGKGFGTVALLAGVDRDSLDLLRGASFSGRTQRPVGLRIGVSSRSTSGNVLASPRIEYTIETKRQRTRNDRIRRHDKYQ